jgi:hypothetical protein
MGIRVHKALGYGLTDVAFDKENYEIIDGRFNPNAIKRENIVADRFIAFLKTKLTEDIEDFDTKILITTLENKMPLSLVWSSFVMQTTFGGASIFLITPVEYIDEWHRYDEMIDWVEESQNYQQTNRYQLIDRPLYPYDVFMHADTGEIFPHGCQMTSVVNQLLKSGELNSCTEFLKAKGFGSITEFKNTVVPKVPMSVRYMAEWLGIFKDPKTVLNLRPMVTVYWS